MKRDQFVATEEHFAPILKTGDKFKATTSLGKAVYEFVGYAPQENSCRCIILKNLETGSLIGVEHLWFDTEVCGRKIELLKEDA